MKEYTLIEMKKDQEEKRSEIQKLQESLPLIRNAGGWTAEEFGEMIGVTKQTISNLENNKTPMTKTQYIAIRAVLDFEMSEHPDNTLLINMVDLCLNRDELTKNEKDKMQAFLMGAKRTKLDRVALLAGLTALLGATAGNLISMPRVRSGAGTWLANILKRKK